MAKQPKKPFGERRHAGNPAVEAARHHYRTRALRRGRQTFDPATRTWLRGSVCTCAVSYIAACPTHHAKASA